MLKSIKDTLTNNLYNLKKNDSVQTFQLCQTFAGKMWASTVPVWIMWFTELKKGIGGKGHDIILFINNISGLTEICHQIWYFITLVDKIARKEIK